ncbi:DNA-binding response regulator, OmpR family, contains REC and winged-helix (wHTH) domain [Klenkia soli]|uniref:DNA-binding response regulator, OmpR family, contains REC and winged-helix (WHTH) domain n=1 Tax=Klenkia soli TaxID=1052260 RepID=A0A1H0E9N2_9ACTN|nr:response regulator transcription factor [Klenkia soli]SDN79006.1 DNA-binding response regulator, OmpR family, contains REC and winged-helix (wHTH) domain [Klenkia soli]
MSTILLVDDETAITDNLQPFLVRSGFEVVVAGDGDTALARIADAAPDLVVLDVLMPGRDGRSVLREVRQSGGTVPIILLTQIGESGERAMALEEGADDYLNKPFDPHELVARIRAVLRRGAPPSGPSLAGADRLRSGRLVVDRTSQRVLRDGAEVVLTPRATTLLAYLMSHPGETVSRERLLEEVWGWSFHTSTRTVDTRVAELRRVVEVDSADPQLVVTVPGEGYRFVGPVEAG